MTFEERARDIWLNPADYAECTSDLLAKLSGNVFRQEDAKWRLRGLRPLIDGDVGPPQEPVCAET
eukprot:6646978-Lingulodinium_polyedra.AAC.1